MSLRNRSLAALLGFALLNVCSVAAAVDAEPMDIDVEILAKLAKEKAKRSAEASASGRSLKNGGKSSECGSIDIGNVVTGGKPGFNPREITVIITGDVINANNKCK